MFLVENERVKLTATWLNALAAALIAAGGFAPAAAWLYGLTALQIAPGYLAGLVVGISLHLSGLAVLGRLRE